ncbi:MAG TPA: C10 family peptidase [bacterium]|nr:C10 family peptidase [bacterium]
MKKSTINVVFLCLGICILSPGTWATRVTDHEMNQVCANWLALFVHENGQWAGSDQPRIMESNDIEWNGEFLGRCYNISPTGYIAIPVLKELPPVFACSEENGLNLSTEGGSPLLLKELLSSRITQYKRTYGSLEAAQPDNGTTLFDPELKHLWALLTDTNFTLRLEDDTVGPITQVGPILTSRWHQNAPYNYFCPSGDGGQCVVGCVATAASQIMAHHRIPGSGSGSNTYFWDGDQSCGGMYAGGNLSATFSDGYDWGNMPDHCTTSSSTAAQAAVAELCFEVGVALEMDYGYCGSGADTFATAVVLPTHFGYKSSASVQHRINYSAQGWLDMLKTDLNRGFPTIYRFDTSSGGHAVVCDGWRDTGGISQYHINYGWSNTSYNDWYTVDYITGSVDWSRESAVVGLEPLGSTPPPSMTVDVTMPLTFYQAGDTCYCSTYVTNSSGSAVSNLPLFVILEISGAYFFAPSFNSFNYYSRTFGPGTTTVGVLPSFSWPAGSGAFNGARFYAAMTNPQVTQLVSNVDMFTFGWNGGGGGTWTNIKTENFEGTWPNNWSIYVDNGYADCYWDAVNCFQNSGNRSGWCGGGGSQSGADCSSYVNNMSTLLRYGPFSLAGATDAEVQFAIWNQVEPCTGYCDYFGCYASVNGQNYYGFNVKETTNGWVQATLDLKNVYQLGNLCGQPTVYIGFYFFSDGSITNYGTYIDDIVIRKK